jgi:D-serine deaminase-like pyridoxal phosphate-dependent protein
MTSSTRRQVVVSTLAEARFYLENGFDDITYAYPVSFDKLPRCAELLNKLQLFHITVDNMEIINALGKYVLPESSKKWSVLLMVDCGYGRGNFSRTYN